MFKKIAILAAIGCSTFVAHANPKGEVHYTPIETNPDLYARSLLNLSLIDMEMGKNINFGYSLKFETMIGDKIAPYIKMMGTYYTLHGSFSDEAEYKPVEDKLKPYQFELGGTYYFFDKNYAADVPVVLRQTSHGRYTVTHYTTIPSEVKHMIGVSAGFFQKRNIAELKTNSASLYNFKSFDGTYNQPLSNFMVNERVTYLQSSGASIFAGIKYRNIKRTIVNVEECGKRENTTGMEYYFDLILQPSSSISDVVVPLSDSSNGNPGGYHLIAKSSALSHFGFRAGYSRQTTKNFNGYQNFEFGFMPGYTTSASVFGHGLYCKLGYGFSIGSRKHFKLGAEAAEPVKSKKIETTSTPPAQTI